MRERRLASSINKRIIAGFVCSLVLGFLMTVPARGALLGIVAQAHTNPDLFSPNLTVTYTASNGLFKVTGDTSAYTLPNGSGPDDVTDVTSGFSPGSFTLSATIGTNGVFSSGSLTISGAIDALSIPASTLLQGTITAFGFLGNSSPTPDEFDFRFNVTGGALASAFGSVGGTLLHPGNTPFNNSFTSSFSNDGFGTADTKAVPEPSSALLVVMSLLGLCGVVRRMPLRKC